MAADKQANAVLSDEILDLMERMEQLDAQQKEAKAKVEVAKVETAKVHKEVSEKVKKLQGEVHRVSSELGAGRETPWP
jgi:predicted  nucleic acid-binding Zn-ribbon protein